MTDAKRKPMRRYDRSDVDNAVDLADKYSVEDIEKMVRDFVRWDRTFDRLIALVMALSLWMSNAKQMYVDLPVWGAGYVSVPPSLVVLFCVYILLIFRHGRISQGMMLAIAHGIASERARREATGEPEPSKDASE